MIIRICYFFIYIIEGLISFYFFENKYCRRIKESSLFATYFCCFFICFLCSSFEIMLLNSALFVVSNFLISYFCYESNIKSCIFSNLILVVIMFSTEMLVMLTSSLIQDTNLTFPYNDDFKFVTQALLSKLFYFVAIYIVSKISGKEAKADKDSFSLPLSILPLSSAIVVYTTFYLCLNYEISHRFQLAFELGNILLVTATILVYYIHEVTRKTNKKYTQILLEQQHSKNYLEYYELLKEQNETSKILIHDMTKHLNAIKELSGEDNVNLDKYIDTIVDDFNVQSPINYCSNPLINLITYRYLELCKKDNISMFVDIRSSKIDFMEEPDITSLFDNLLENALEAATKTVDRQIDFSMHVRNKNFLIIKITNSCESKPLFKNNDLITTKETGLHGFGTRSIKRVVLKYCGDMRLSYDDNSNVFTVTIIMPIPIAD